MCMRTLSQLRTGGVGVTELQGGLGIWLSEALVDDNICEHVLWLIECIDQKVDAVFKPACRTFAQVRVSKTHLSSLSRGLRSN
jgi:hypothetical protein